MKAKKGILCAIMCTGLIFSTVGCGSNKKTAQTPNSGNTTANTGTGDALANDINGIFGGSGLDGTNGYNNRNGYGNTNSYGSSAYNGTGTDGINRNDGLTGQGNDRFGFGMQGAENIMGNINGTTNDTTTNNTNKGTVNR